MHRICPTFRDPPRAAPSEMPSLYFESNALKGPFNDRSSVELKQFCFALWEMSRLYCYREMNVIVLPHATVVSKFPIGPDAWGLVNPDQYGYRG